MAGPDQASSARHRTPAARAVPAPALILLAAAVGCVGGIYGTGGGSILAPILIGTGRPPGEVAPALGAYTGARIQQQLPETLIRRTMGVLVAAIGARYPWSGLG